LCFVSPPGGGVVVVGRYLWSGRDGVQAREKKYLFNVIKLIETGEVWYIFYVIVVCGS
jgi:hypothetical protein